MINLYSDMKTIEDPNRSMVTFSVTGQFTTDSAVILRFLFGNGFDKRHPLKGRELARFF